VVCCLRYNKCCIQGSDEVMQFLVTIVNKIFEELDIPESTKYGTVTPVLKPNKDKIYPENYRRITVTNTFLPDTEMTLHRALYSGACCGQD
jgi:hypothetical protein